MALQFKKARRSQAKVKIAIGGVSGSGKTMSSLLLAYGIVKAEHPQWNEAECWEHICIIDTENSSGSLYVGYTIGINHIGEYNTIDLEPPFEAGKYVDAIHLAEQNDQCVIIIDSMSHAWNSTGGALERQSQIAARTGNSYTAWAPVKSEIKKMMDAILQSPSHIISDFRAKQEYVQEKNERGKTVVRNVGLGFVFQDSAEYEFTTLFYLDNDHIANATKDRTGMFSGKFFEITPDTGKKFAEWLSAGAIVTEDPKPVMKKAEPHVETAPIPASEPPVEEFAPPMDDPFEEPASAPAITIAELDQAVRAHVRNMGTADRQAFGDVVASIGKSKDYRHWTDQDAINKLYAVCTQN